LRQAVNGIFGDGDDVVFDVKPRYRYVESTGVSQTILDLGRNGHPLPVGEYRLKVLGTAAIGLYDAAGNRLDGNRDGEISGTLLDSYVRLFSVTDTTPPMITGIFATGSLWSTAFIDAVDGGGTGSGNGIGHLLTRGLTLPGSGIDRIFVQFSEPVLGFNATSFALLGVNVADYSSIPDFLSVSYDSLNKRGVIQLSTSVLKDKLRIVVSDTVTDLAMNALDGDLNASAGGVFDFRFNVLVGDANHDGSVNGGDLPSFASSFNRSVGNLGYNPRADWNSDGSVNGGDLPAFANHFNQSLPLSEPDAWNIPPPLPPVPELEWMYAPLIENIDNLFSQLDEEDELLLLEY
jgi:hypothetical protein